MPATTENQAPAQNQLTRLDRLFRSDSPSSATYWRVSDIATGLAVGFVRDFVWTWLARRNTDFFQPALEGVHGATLTQMIILAPVMATNFAVTYKA